MNDELSTAEGRRLRELITQRLADGSLPHFRNQRIFGGRGDGTRCCCCDELIALAQVQYDVEHNTHATRPGDAPAAERTLAMHLQCYRLWCEASEDPRTPPAAAIPPSIPPSR